MNWNDTFHQAAAELHTTAADLTEVCRDWLSDACAEIPRTMDPATVAQYVDHSHLDGWAGFLTDPYLRDGLAALAITRVKEPLTVQAAAELLRVDLVDVVSVLADWALAASQPGTLGVWNGDVIGNAGLQLLHYELINRDPYPSRRQLEAARVWVDNCDFPDVAGQGLTAADLTDDEIRSGIDATYQGGWIQFLADLIPFTLPRETTKTSDQSGEI